MKIITPKNRTGKNIPAYICIHFKNVGKKCRRNKKMRGSITFVETEWVGFFKKAYNRCISGHECVAPNSEFFSGMFCGMLDNFFEKEYEYIFIDDITKLFPPDTSEFEDFLNYLEFIMHYRNIDFTLFVPSTRKLKR
jgi:hypothetical protein